MKYFIYHFFLYFDMYPFKSKRNFKKISILIAIPYIILCMTSGGLHALDKRAYHGHCLEDYSSKTENTENDVYHKQGSKNTTSFCFNDHSADNCGICKWIKNTSKKVQFPHRYYSFFQDCSTFCIFDQSVYDFLKFSTNSPRSPPFFIS